MSERLTDLVLGLQRMAENTRLRGDDLEYTHREEKYEYIRYLDQLLAVVEKVRGSLLEDRKKHLPVERERVQQYNLPQDESIPRVVTKGPLPEHLRPKEQATG